MSQAENVVGIIRDHYESLRYFHDFPIALLSIANILDKSSTSIIVPLLPIYAQQMALSGVDIGLLFSLPPLVRGFTSPATGYLSDRFSRKPFIIVGMALSAVGVVGIAFAESLLLLFVLRGIDGLGSGLRNPSTNAYLGDYASDENRGQIMGAYQTSGMLAIAVGPALGGVLSSVGGISLPFMVLGGATMIGAFALVPLPASGITGEASLGLPKAGVVREQMSVPIVILLGSAFISDLGTTMIDPLFAQVLQQNLNASPSLIGLSWSMLGVGLLIFLPIGGKLSDERDRVGIITVGKVIWVVVMFGIATVTWEILPPVLMFMGGIGSALMGPAMVALRYEVSPEQRKASLLGVFATFGAAGSVLGPLLGGALSNIVGISNTILLAVGLWIVEGVLLLVLLFVDE